MPGILGFSPIHGKLENAAGRAGCYYLAIRVEKLKIYSVPAPPLRRNAKPAWAFLLGVLMGISDLRAQDETAVITFEDAVVEYQKGNYRSLLPKVSARTEENPWNDAWWSLAVELRMTLGQYAEADWTAEEGLERRSYSIRLRLAALEAARYNNLAEKVEEHRKALGTYFSMWAYRVRSPDDLVDLGEVALLLGVDPKIVLENFFKPAREEEEPPARAFLASGRLALKKYDYQLASKTFQQGLEKYPTDPDLWHGLARSFLNGDRSQLVRYSEHALGLNPNHQPSLLLLAEHLIDAEAYAPAKERLAQVLSINPLHPRALALKAAIAYLQNDPLTGDLLRSKALSNWKENPEVDHTIGRKLSQKYWFAEGAEAQRRALAFDPEYHPASIQLSQDLLRLGIATEDEGWQLASHAHEHDPYNVEAYNLVTLADKLDRFTTLESENFHLRLSEKEAPIYGRRALALLERAHARLTEVYGIALDGKTIVEIYPNSGDFAVRTFGMPGIPGFLGVCFGPVITINSPSTRQANWESVLWHEFCHTITLKMTRNRIPRWLSEGISVFEEMEENPSWGRRMTIPFRNRILDRRMLPISEMSGAFLLVENDEDIQFAYFQSYLAVKFFSERYGMRALRDVLLALGDGMDPNEALSQYLDPMEVLNRDFAGWARERAGKLGGDYDLSTPKNALERALVQMNREDSYHFVLQRARELVKEKKWELARDRLETLVKGAGYIPGEENAHGLLAHTYGQLGLTEREYETWETMAQTEGGRMEAVVRLLEIATEREDWAAAKSWSEAWLAIDPLAQTPWRTLFRADRTLNQPEKAILSGKVLLRLDPSDRANVHFLLARQMTLIGDKGAHRQALMALEEAPRYRDAYELLFTLTESEATEPFPHPTSP